MSDSSSQAPGSPPPDPWPLGPPAGFGFGQNIPISELPLAQPLTGQEWVPLAQADPTGQLITVRANAWIVAGTTPVNPNAVPPAFAQGQTIVSGPAPIFPWVPTALNALPLVQTFNGRNGSVVLTSVDVTTALGYVPYDSANPANFQTDVQVAASISAALPLPSNATPAMDGSPIAGTSTQWSRGDHVHPTDTSRYSVTNPSGFQTAAQVTAALAPYMPLAGGTFSGAVAFGGAAIISAPANFQLGGGAPGQILSSLGGSTTQWVTPGGGIPDAPSDGQLYGRQNATWTVVPTGGGGGIPDSPNDGTMYARMSASWQHITSANIEDWATALAPYALTANVPVGSTTTPLMDGTAAVGTGTTWARADHVHPSDTSRIGDAPNNGTSYVRNSAAWIPLPPIAVTISDTPPASPVVGGLWWDSVGGQLYVWYNDGSSSQWVIAVNVGPALSAYLPLTGGTLSGALTAPQVNAGALAASNGTSPPVAVASPPASDNSLSLATTAWINGLSLGENRIINGDMRIDQRNAGAAGTATGYTIDRWQYAASQAAKATWGRNLGPPATSAPGFPYEMGFSSSSAYAPLAADYFIFYQTIEADMVSDFAWGTANAQPVTLSFWVIASIAGTYSGAIRNMALTRTYPFAFAATQAWTKVVITIPGDAAGTWVMSGNGGSLQVVFDLGNGSSSRGPAGAWASNSWSGVTGSAQLVATTGASIYFTGVKLEIGSRATPFNRQSLAKSYADCQRYFEKSYDQEVAAGTAGVAGDFLALYGLPNAAYSLSVPCSFRVAKRATPTVIVYSTVTGASGVIRNAVTSADVAASALQITTHGFSAYPSSVLSSNTGINLQVAWVAGAEL